MFPAIPRIRVLVRLKIPIGYEVEIFEKEFSKYIGTKHGISTSSGKLSLYLVLQSLNLKKNDEIILSSFNASSVSKVVKLLCLKPIFVDVDKSTWNLDTSLLEESITKKTKAIIATHNYGNPCDIKVLLKIAKKYNIGIIEDCAHACGAEFKGKKVGSFGSANIFSFGLGKHINTISGGMVLTNDDTIYNSIKKNNTKLEPLRKTKFLKMLFLHSFVKTFSYPWFFSFTLYPVMYFFGNEWLTKLFEYDPKKRLEKIKFTNFQAKMGLNELKIIKKINSKRIENAKIYRDELENIDDIHLQQTIRNCKHAYLSFPVAVKNRQTVIKKMINEGIDIQRTWMKSFEGNISSWLEKSVIYLPVYPQLSQENILKLAKSLKESIK